MFIIYFQKCLHEHYYDDITTGKNMTKTGLVAIQGSNAAFPSLGGAKVLDWIYEPRWLPYQNKRVILERKFGLTAWTWVDHTWVKVTRQDADKYVYKSTDSHLKKKWKVLKCPQ